MLMGQSNSRERMHRTMMADFSKSKEKVVLLFETDEGGRLILDRIELEEEPENVRKPEDALLYLQGSVEPAPPRSGILGFLDDHGGDIVTAILYGALILCVIMAVAPWIVLLCRYV